MKKVKLLPLNGKNKKKIYFFSVNTKNISSHVLKISAISLALRTRESTDIFNTFDEIQGVESRGLHDRAHGFFVRVFAHNR